LGQFPTNKLSRGIAVPTLVIAGQYDQVEPQAVQEELMLPALSQARMVVLPYVGHLLPLEAPVEVAAEIRRFLDTAVQGTGPK
jgi:pimeloyl-ACP methyl ester carboxylesterase